MRLTPPVAMKSFALALALCAAGLPGLAQPGAAATPAGLSVRQVIDRYVTARGGRKAWSELQTMAWVGHMQSSSQDAAGTPFVMEMKRPDKTRFELNQKGRKSLRAFDGVNGWSLRQGKTGPEVLDYTPAERAFAAEAFGMDGPLMNYPGNGVKASLGGVEELEGRKAYHLELVLPSGARRQSWIDAQTFLEVRNDRTAVDAAQRPVTVSVYYRNYQSFTGVQIPLTIETGVGVAHNSDKMVIEKVAINPPITDQFFEKPRPMKRPAAVSPSYNGSAL
jgi:hypothetical protein